MSILIVEDSDIDALIVERILRRENYPTVRARNGTEAMEVLSFNNSIRLVFADIMMPEMDGLEMVQRIKETIPRPIPVVFCSSLADMDSVRRAVGLGCTSYILKPVRRKMLLEKIEAALEKEMSIEDIVPATAPPPKPKEGESVAPKWQSPELVKPSSLELNGSLGEAFDQVLERLQSAPYSADWLLSEVTFEKERPFNHLSGDLLGRFLQISASHLTEDHPLGTILLELALKIGNHQREDGHFGRPVNWKSRDQIIQLGIPILWGNGRLLKGLVRAAVEMDEPDLLQAACRLGDFYVATASFLSPYSDMAARFYSMAEIEMSASYFPAIEGLVALHSKTGNPAYLAVAERLANFFKPLERSVPQTQSFFSIHCGLLALYATTKKEEYLNLSQRAWERTLTNKCVWATGAVGHVLSSKTEMDEGCAEAEWLRFNLELWRATGHSRYLHMADRLVHNGLVSNQLPSGGFGNRELDPTRDGPIALFKRAQENSCCSISGYNALTDFKRYLAFGNEAGIYLNFIEDCATTVTADGCSWRLEVQTFDPIEPGEIVRARVTIEAITPTETPRIGFFFVLPTWVNSVSAFDMDGNPVPLTHAHDYRYGTYLTQSQTELELIFDGGFCIENRFFQKVYPRKGRFRDIVLRAGPEVLFAGWHTETPTILIVMDESGRATLPQDKLGRYVTAVVQDGMLVDDQAALEIADCQPLYLAPWQTLHESTRRIYSFNAVVVRNDSPFHAALQSAAERINVLL